METIKVQKTTSYGYPNNFARSITNVFVNLIFKNIKYKSIDLQDALVDYETLTARLSESDPHYKINYFIGYYSTGNSTTIELNEFWRCYDHDYLIYLDFSGLDKDYIEVTIFNVEKEEKHYKKLFTNA